MIIKNNKNKRNEGNKMKKGHIYFAGGWFSPEQEERHTRVYEALIAAGHEVFNPKLESLIKPDSTEDHMTQTLIGNIDGVIEAKVVVVLADKPYDSGTIWEAGLAYGKTPIVYYAENLGGKPFNLMLAKTGKFAGNVEDLIKVLEDPTTYELSQVYVYEGEIE